MAHNRQFMIRVTQEQYDILGKIAIEEDLVGGPGVKSNEPNRSAVARLLMGRADRRIAENAPATEWARRG